MGLIELIVGLLIFIFLVNFVFSFVPIPNGIAGTLVALLIIILVWRLVF